MWNCHLIRPQKKGDTVAGVPEILHAHSELTGNNKQEPEGSKALTWFKKYFLWKTNKPLGVASFGLSHNLKILVKGH